MPTIDPGVRIGHVHLKVANLQRALDFYCGVLGFELTTSRPGAAFISGGGYHHHLGLNTWESLGGSPPSPGTTGLYHSAILYPTRRLLADALRRLIVAKIPLEGASDHRVSEALYCATQTTMASSSTGTGRKRTGRRSPTAHCRCLPIHLICMTCLPNWTSPRLDVTRRGNQYKNEQRCNFSHGEPPSEWVTPARNAAPASKFPISRC